ncbi:MAG: hypothetical protein PW789_03410 [Edaphobacter sp.]|uniref:hypothetical protein n=1 Tax=Edaphobacter sp. TaxID=1934404 RepID=UPI002393646E|nr:hypothetical protein [Edaphobacter sp.]MDE1175633.1 hypothetical protein [Edaphobacter sp.]
MKRILSTAVATLCLLILFVSSAACVALPMSQASMTADSTMPSTTLTAPAHECCPSHSPMQHSSISCCIVHHQPAVASSDDASSASLAIASAHLTGVLLNSATVVPPASKKTGPPPRRPAHNLRI